MTPARALAAFSLLAALAGPALAQEPLAAGAEGVPVPKKTKHVQPVYPAEALAQGIRGIVIVDLVIAPTGKVQSTSIIRSVPGLDDAAVAAVSQWEYEPVKVDGKPVAVRLTVPITFALALPKLARDGGIPELRQGAAPVWPAGAPDGGGSAVADVTLGSDGRVETARITGGDEPWAGSLLTALRTWRFPPPDEDVVLSFRVSADFAGGKADQRRVELKASGLRREELLGAAHPGGAAPADAAPATAQAAAPPPAAAPATAPAAATGAASPAPATTASAAQPAAQLPPAVKTADATPAAAPAAAPASVTPSASAPVSAPVLPSAPASVPPSTPAASQAPHAVPSSESKPSPATAPSGASAAPPPPADAATPRPAATATGPSASAGAAPPPVEVITAPPPPAPVENGVSAIRDVTLLPGVPDLARGRRPVSPPVARMSGTTGTVEVAFSVSAAGGTTVQAVVGPEPLRRAAQEAVGSWVFRRTRADRAYLVAVFNYAEDRTTAEVRPQPAPPAGAPAAPGPTPAPPAVGPTRPDSPSSGTPKR